MQYNKPDEGEPNPWSRPSKAGKKAPGSKKSEKSFDDAGAKDSDGHISARDKKTGGSPKQWGERTTKKKSDTAPDDGNSGEDRSERGPRKEKSDFKPRTFKGKSGDREGYKSNSYGDKKKFGDKRSFGGGKDRPDRGEGRPEGDKPWKRADNADRPKRSYDKKFESKDGPRAPRAEGDKPWKPKREDSTDRPKRSYDKKFESKDGPRAPRAEGDKPWKPKREGSDDRPKRTYEKKFEPRERPEGTHAEGKDSEDRPKRPYEKKFEKRDRPGTSDGDRPKRPYEKKFEKRERPEGGDRDDRPKRPFDKKYDRNASTGRFEKREGPPKGRGRFQQEPGIDAQTLFNSLPIRRLPDDDELTDATPKARVVKPAKTYGERKDSRFPKEENKFAPKGKRGDKDKDKKNTFADTLNAAFKEERKKPVIEGIPVHVGPPLPEVTFSKELESKKTPDEIDWKPAYGKPSERKTAKAGKVEVVDLAAERKAKKLADATDQPAKVRIPKKSKNAKRVDEDDDDENDGKVESMPLNKYIAHSGECSRRDAALMVKEGKVKVNGELVTDPGYKVQDDDKVTIAGKKLTPQKGHIYVLLNKPKGYITTNDDPQGRRTVMDLVLGAGRKRLYPVGRLDRDTTGLLLLTNDGDLTQRLSHPSYEMKKVYQVTLNKPLTKADFEKIMGGLELEDGKAKVDEMAYLEEKNELGLEIHSGKNRIVRRIFEHLGYVVEKLDRVMYAGLTKKNLPRSKWRFLDEREIVLLKHFKS